MSEPCVNKQRFLLVVSGPSGCGKDTVVQLMMRKHPKIELSISATTRAPRGGETHGVHYYFLSRPQFDQCIAEEDLLEHAEYVGQCYGTLRSEVEKRMDCKITCVLVIEVEGAAHIKERYPECTTVFILPPSMQELERRLRGRASENEEWVRRRMARAEQELALAHTYDYQIVNEDVDACADALYDILQQRQK